MPLTDIARNAYKTHRTQQCSNRHPHRDQQPLLLHQPYARPDPPPLLPTHHINLKNPGCIKVQARNAHVTVYPGRSTAIQGGSSHSRHRGPTRGRIAAALTESMTEPGPQRGLAGNIDGW